MVREEAEERRNGEMGEGGKMDEYFYPSCP